MATPPRIAIIDDNELEYKLLTEAFESVKWTVELLSIAREDRAFQELLSLAEQNRAPDLVLLDIMFGTQTSLPLLKAIREHPLLSKLSVVCISTTMPPESIRQSYIDYGVLTCLKKSQDFAGLIKFANKLKQFLIGNGKVSSGGSFINNDVTNISL